ncbi:MAG: cell wall hydrolase [Pseudomonadota bacterium]|nr:cell wall hydrolase [Pseudomonadota bacterium]
MIGPIARVGRAVVLAAAGLAACHAASLGGPPPKARSPIDADFSPAGQARLEASMSGAMLAIAHRLDKERRSDLAGRAPGWAVLDVATPPTLGFGALSPEAAERINAFLPAVSTPPPAVPPFFLNAAGPERERALLCLTQAIYYEAALEPTSGQEAVAQTVLNRVRHPAFPHSICGVVYEGAQQPTGCQFSFACDGSRQRPPIAPFWQRAQAVARQAVAGFVMPAVGTATAYHADYVFPRWGPTLVKIAQIGAHIFYRFPGPAGLPGALRQRYGAGEMQVSMAGPSPGAILAARGGAAPGPGETIVKTYAWADPSAPGGMHIEPGQVVFGHRTPTREEIARINATLLALEKREPPIHAPPPATFSDALPISKP